MAIVKLNPIEIVKQNETSVEVDMQEVETV